MVMAPCRQAQCSACVRRAGSRGRPAAAPMQRRARCLPRQAMACVQVRPARCRPAHAAARHGVITVRGSRRAAGLLEAAAQRVAQLVVQPHGDGAQHGAAQPGAVQRVGACARSIGAWLTACEDAGGSSQQRRWRECLRAWPSRPASSPRVDVGPNCVQAFGTRAAMALKALVTVIAPGQRQRQFGVVDDGVAPWAAQRGSRPRAPVFGRHGLVVKFPPAVDRPRHLAAARARQGGGSLMARWAGPIPAQEDGLAHRPGGGAAAATGPRRSRRPGGSPQPGAVASRFAWKRLF